MNADDLLVMISIPAAPALLALAACGIFLVPRARWITLLALALAAAMAATFLIFWVVWGRAFDYADSNRPVPESLDRAKIASGLLFGAAYLLFLGTSIVTMILSRRGGGRSSGPGQVGPAHP